MIEADKQPTGELVPVKKEKQVVYSNGVPGAFYGLAFVGAAVYYIQQANTFWMGVVGLLKALFWPAMLMYRLLEIWKM